MRWTRFLALFCALFLFAGTTAFAQEGEDADAEVPVEEEAPAQQDVVSMLAASGNFTILVDALQRTGLAEQLQTEGAVTIFAPTDQAFAALPEGTLESLSADELSEILKRHVALGVVMAEQLAADGSVATAQGDALTVGSDGATVEDAAIVAADVQASNGVIHAIDKVILAEGGEEAPAPEEGAEDDGDDSDY